MAKKSQRSSHGHCVFGEYASGKRDRLSAHFANRSSAEQVLEIAKKNPDTRKYVRLFVGEE